MAKPIVKQVHATDTIDDPQPQWEAVVDYGDGVEVVIPLRAHRLSTDERHEDIDQLTEAMESLAEALIDFADHLRRQL